MSENHEQGGAIYTRKENSMTISIGHDAFVNTDKIQVILPWQSGSVKKFKKQAATEDKLIDATFGNPTKTLIILINGWVVLSALRSRTISARFNYALSPEPAD